MRKKSARRKTRTPQKKRFLFWQRGGIAETAILVVIIIGAFFLVGGFFPKDFANNVGAPIDGEIDDSSIEAQDSLQLGTLKFKDCASIVTMDLLLDQSDSMNNQTPSGSTKISRLKQAVSGLTNKLSDDSIIGIQTFNTASSEPYTPILNDLVPISYYKDVKANLTSQVNGMRADGATPTHDALAFSYEKLQEGVAQYPDRQFNFILISDGAPCPGFGCSGPNAVPGRNQDPRDYTPNPADQIKDLGVNVYTLGIYSGGFFWPDPNEPKLRELLISIASSPDNYFEAKTADDVAQLLSQISNRICEGDLTGTPIPTP